MYKIEDTQRYTRQEKEGELMRDEREEREEIYESKKNSPVVAADNLVTLSIDKEDRGNHIEMQKKECIKVK